jgi:hypothetical protein
MGMNKSSRAGHSWLVLLSKTPGAIVTSGRIAIAAHGKGEGADDARHGIVCR